MSKMLARIVVRDCGDDNDGLILGALSKEGKSFFKPGYVYQIEELFGEVYIREVGPSWIKNTRKESNVCWAHDVNSILSDAEKSVVLTEKEYKELRSTNNKRSDDV